MRKQERGQCTLRHGAIFSGAGAMRESSHDLHIIRSDSGSQMAQLKFLIDLALVCLSTCCTVIHHNT